MAVLHMGLNLTKAAFGVSNRVSNRFDPDQDQHSVGPDLGLNCLQRLDSNQSAHAELQRLARKFKICL